MGSLTALVSIFVESCRLDDVVQALSRLVNVEGFYEVTGEFDIVSIVRAPDVEKLRDVLKNGIMKIEGVRSTVTSIVLSPHKGAISPDESLTTLSAVSTKANDSLQAYGKFGTGLSALPTSTG